MVGDGVVRDDVDSAENMGVSDVVGVEVDDDDEEEARVGFLGGVTIWLIDPGV